MNMQAQRRLIAAKSPVMKLVDPRPRCSCGEVLTMRDFEQYWNEGAPVNEAPVCCEDCAERAVKP
jgi:hypothetical protein